MGQWGMEIQLNGIGTPVPTPCTIDRLLGELAMAQRKVAVEVNGVIVPRGVHASHVLHAGDRVEIVHALGGG